MCFSARFGLERSVWEGAERRLKIRLGRYLVQFEWMSRHSGAEDEKHTLLRMNVGASYTLTFSGVNVL